MNSAPQHELPRRIGFWGGSAIMVGVIIGSGIFRTPTAIAAELASPAFILLLWLLGGVLSLFGALTYAELGTMFPHSGGIYNYLYRGFGETTAFVFGWTYMVLTKPLAAAGISMVFAEHLNRLLGVSWDERVVVCVVLLGLTLINVVNMRAATAMAVVFTSLKVFALAGIVLFGLSALPELQLSGPTLARHSLLHAFAPVMAAILWTYDGWSDIASVAGEVHEPHTKLPKILTTGVVGVTLLYLAVNAVYMALIPLDEMQHATTVAPLVMEKMLGSAGSTAVTAMILISTLGASHSSVITGARVTFAQARDGLLFKTLGHIHPQYLTPDVSLWSQALFACAVTWMLGTFEKLTSSFVFTMWIFYGMAALAVIVLRVREPERERPYRCWGYPYVPVIFVLSALVMTVLSIMESWTTTLPWLALLFAGAPMHAVWKRWTRA